MTNANENPYYPVTLQCRPIPITTNDFYVPCENLYQGYYDGGVVRIFFFRQGSPTTPECWSQTGPQTINLNKRAMVDDAMGKVFIYYAQNAETLESPSSTGAAQNRYRVYDGKFAVNAIPDDNPMYVQDLAIRWVKLQYETYAVRVNSLRGPRGQDGIHELPRYVYWRYQDGDNWTKVDTGVPFTPYTEEGPFLTEGLGSSYYSSNFVFHNDSANFPDGSSQIQFTAYNAEQFEFLEDYMSSQYPDLDPSTITIAKINRDGEFNTYPIASIVDNGTYYTVTLDTTKDVVAAFDTDFEPDGSYMFRFDPHDTSSDPPGAVGTPYGTYSVRDGKWAVSAYAVNRRVSEQNRTHLDPWSSYGRGDWYHEHIWYWRYADRETGGVESAWTKHTQLDGYSTGITHPQSGNPSLPYQFSNVEFYNKYDRERYSVTTHFQADSEPANFPDGTRPIELTSDPRVTDRLFVMFDRPVLRPRLVVDQTIKQEDFGSFYTKGTGTPPDQDAGLYDEVTNTVTYVDQSPNREGQVITYIAPGVRGVASMFISVETSPGVFEWKGRG